MSERSTPHASRPPASLKWGALAVVAALIAGAGYLMIVRGPALILDLAAGFSSMICF